MNIIRRNTSRSWSAVAVIALVALGGALPLPAAHAAAGCRVSYTVTSQWSGGFGAQVAVTNLGDPINGWRVTWSFAAGQTITQVWNGTLSRSGTEVTVADAGWNGSLGTGKEVSFGLNGTVNGSENPSPSAFTLNGTTCTGAVVLPSPTPTTPSPTTTSPSTPTPTTPSPSTPSPTSPDVDGATIVPDPSWTCGTAGGLLPPTLGKPVLQATLRQDAVREVGATQYGTRRIRNISGGTVTGGRVSGSVLTGGLELDLTLSNGAMETEGLQILRTGDGTLIYLRSCGVAPAGTSTVRFVPDFEAPTSSSYAWLNTGTFVGTRVIDPTGTVSLSIYDVSGVSATSTVRLKDPAGTAQQPWTCAAASGSRGASVFTENVTLGSSLSVGASKRGTRNIIPITGGSMSGRLTGSVLPGGADYQLLGSAATLDARYVLLTGDGEFVIVRNCGRMGALVPTFEARAAGPYGFLTTGSWLSSDPGMGAGGVSITIYERR